MTPPLLTDGTAHWKRNLYVCLFGSFTTIVAMTLLLPFLPLYLQHLGRGGAHAELLHVERQKGQQQGHRDDRRKRAEQADIQVALPVRRAVRRRGGCHP